MNQSKIIQCLHKTYELFDFVLIVSYDENFCTEVFEDIIEPWFCYLFDKWHYLGLRDIMILFVKTVFPIKYFHSYFIT